MHYSRSYKKIIMGTTQGLIGVLGVEAEAINEDEENDDDQHGKDRETKVIDTPFVELGRYHTKKINGIRELGDTTQLITISEDQSAAIWEATNFSQLARITFFSNPTAVDVSVDGQVHLLALKRECLEFSMFRTEPSLDSSRSLDSLRVRLCRSIRSDAVKMGSM